MSLTDAFCEIVQHGRRLCWIDKLQPPTRIFEIVYRLGERHQIGHLGKLSIETKLLFSLMVEKVLKQYVIDLLVVIELVKIE